MQSDRECSDRYTKSEVKDKSMEEIIMEVIEFKSEPKGQRYKSLINLAFEICDHFIFVVRDGLGLGDKGKKIIKELEPALIEIKDQSKWPGTEIIGGTVKVYYYKTDMRIKNILINEIEGLYSWMQPNYPEDLCFLRKERKEWLINTCHEKECFILCDNYEELQKINKIKGLDFTVRTFENKKV